MTDENKNALVIKVDSNLDELKELLNEALVKARELEQAIKKINEFQVKIWMV